MVVALAFSPRTREARQADFCEFEACLKYVGVIYTSRWYLYSTKEEMVSAVVSNTIGPYASLLV